MRNVGKISKLKRSRVNSVKKGCYHFKTSKYTYTITDKCMYGRKLAGKVMQLRRTESRLLVHGCTHPSQKNRVLSRRRKV